ncbi:MAG: energy-coupling factor ABC transporter ATP-binding protein [Cytophagales bacterium]|nr:energy-coupling factor ABC transporter ATP-binding protein [Cytophagales bacterium]
MKPAITLHQVSYRYSNGVMALKDINLSIFQGKKTAILGRNGAGKSTLLFLLNGINKPSTGTLKLKDIPYRYDNRSLRNLRRQVGLLFPDPDAQLVAPSVYEEISFGLLNISNEKKWVEQRVDQALERFELEAIAKIAPHQLSAGQKKRVCLAAIMAMEPEVLVCDEPASSLDPYYTRQMFDELDKLNATGKTIIYTSHDIDQVYEWADHLVLVHEGSIAAQGPVAEVVQHENTFKDCGLHLPVVFEVGKWLHLEPLPANLEELKKALKVRQRKMFTERMENN